MHTKEGKFHFDHDYLAEPRPYGGVYLYQIGDWQCQPGRQVGAHTQICHEISCIVSGTGTFFFNGQAYRVRPGDLFLSPQGSQHNIRSSRHDPLRYNYCGFMPDPAAGREYAQLADFFAHVTEPLAQDRHSSVRQVFSLLFNEMIINDESSGLLLQNQLSQLLLLTRRCYRKDAALQAGNHRQRMVYDVVNYIDNNIFGIRKLTDVSRQLGYSYSYVSQSFAAVMGASLSSYYQRRRFEKAVELLAQANTVTQVAEALGFDSVQSFSRFFRKSCGMPPSRYLPGQADQLGQPGQAGPPSQPLP